MKFCEIEKIVTDALTKSLSKNKLEYCRDGFGANSIGLVHRSKDLTEREC
jgi:hypothetical protein